MTSVGWAQSARRDLDFMTTAATLSLSAEVFRCLCAGGRSLSALAMIACSMLLVGAGSRDAAARDCIDVALVLSIDASSSISDEEYRIQTAGIAAALRSPEVLEAIRRAGEVALSAVIWSSETMPKQFIPWTRVRTRAEAELVARAIGQVDRPLRGDTGLGSGLNASLQAFGSLGVCAARRIINVSGDGRETLAFRRSRNSPTPNKVRDAAEAAGIEINALAILDHEKDLKHYFETNVITGPDAFVMEVHAHDSIADAFQKKLSREIGPLQTSALAGAAEGSTR
jgi:hypothetical protein